MLLTSLATVFLSFQWNALCVDAVQLLHLDIPVVAYNTSLLKVGPSEGNVVSISPDNAVVYAISADGTLAAFDPATGAELFHYSPSVGRGSTVCRSGVSYHGVFFNETAHIATNPSNTESNATNTTTNILNATRIVDTTKGYLVYSVADVVSGVDTSSRVIALAHPTGEELWVSSPLEGGAVGTPLISSSGQHVFLNHNSNLTTTGIFSVLNAADGSVLYSQRDSTNPFGPLGIYHNPSEGYYEGGEGNTNDLLVWSYSPREDGTRVGSGGIFAFQFPPLYVEGTEGLSAKLMRTDLAWMTTTAPLIANRGYTMYLGVNSNQLRGWVGGPGLGINRFHNRPTYEQVDLGKGRPGYLPPYSTPTLNMDGSMLYVNLANELMTAFQANLEVAWSLPLETRKSDFVSRTVLSHDEKIVYFTESQGLVRAAKAATGESLWEFEIEDIILSDFSLSPTGETLYLGGESGKIVALTVAETPPPCYICEGGALPKLPQARMYLPGVARGSCLEVMELGLQREIRKENCLTVQMLAEKHCGCETTAAPSQVPSFAPRTSSPTITAIEPSNMPTFEPSFAPPTVADTSGAAPPKLLAFVILLGLMLVIV